MTAAEMEARAAAVNRRAAALLGNTAGHCHTVARALGYELAEGGVDVALVIGTYDRCHHAWLEVGELCVDPTADQFEANLPLVQDQDRAARTYEPALRIPLDPAGRADFLAGELERRGAQPVLALLQS